MQKQSTGNTWFAVSLGLMGLIIGYSIGNVTAENPAPSAPSAAQSAAIDPTLPSLPSPQQAENVPEIDTTKDHIRGDANAMISVIEYSDFECPFCKRHHPVMQRLIEEYDGKVNWVYRHFPLGFHPNAMPAALASECANELGGSKAFWKFADRVFAAQGEFAYEKYATEIGIDADALKKCLDDKKYLQRVQDDMSGGTRAGVNGTPGNIVVNNKTGETRLISGAQPLANFKQVIDQMLGS